MFSENIAHRCDLAAGTGDYPDRRSVELRPDCGPDVLCRIACSRGLFGRR